jgi:hypothetical protein
MPAQIAIVGSFLAGLTRGPRQYDVNRKHVLPKEILLFRFLSFFWAKISFCEGVMELDHFAMNIDFSYGNVVMALQ